jgi:hypothetical protein
MGKSDYYLHGGYNCLCDRCGFKFKSRNLKDTWDGLKVCKECWEPRQPQDFVHGVLDSQAVPWTRPEPTDVFI